VEATLNEIPMKTKFSNLAMLGLLLSSLGVWLPPASAADPPDVVHQSPPPLSTWAQVRPVPMKGDLKVFWNVGGGDVEYNNREAVAHGFRLVNLLGTNADYPGRKGQYYRNLPLFAESLGRVADLSVRLAKAELMIDEPAHVLWKEKRPLVRKFKLSDDEWAVLAVNPWQPDDAPSKVSVRCGAKTVELPLVGRHTGIFEVRGDRVTKR